MRPYNEAHMRTLILQLPTGLPQANTLYLHAWAEGATQTAPLILKWASSQLLPKLDRAAELVVMVPALALSWHRVELPPGLHKQKARLQAALHGLLEERVLDDPAHLHMALPSDWKNAPAAWVAVCDKAWLQAHLAALETQGLTPHRIVPEFNPDAPSLQITATGDAEAGWLWACHAEGGVWGSPLASIDAETWSPQALEGAEIQAEPSVVALTSQKLQTQARLMPPAQHWLAAIASDWDLAQFDVQSDARARQLKTAQRVASGLWHAPQWRWARWGFGLLLCSQLIGLNAWAWKTRANWQSQQQTWAQILRETLPGTSVVVDAPLQMQQGVNRLRQNAGSLAPGDLEAMLMALGQALPPQVSAPRQWRLNDGQLRLGGWTLSDAEQQAIQQTLSTQGYQWRAEGQEWWVSPRGMP